ncbi:MAG: DUF1223 domain-containing protein [Rhodobacteraceae bacterium]|nr:DUF1223 domain-containing protein [Paracoccaceae bacterium]
MKSLIALALGLGVAAASQGAAQDRGKAPVVVELYTSQGCSSCPPADAVMAGLAQRPDVIALALHVDYWDYIGWKDTFADAAYAKRQRAYARVAGARTVYTPQMIVGGMDHLVGVREDELEALIRRFSARPVPVALTLGRKGATVRIEARADMPVPGGAVVQLVRYTPKASVAIERGENAGHRIDYANIVTDWNAVADWDGAEPLSLDVEAPGEAPVVVIVQKPGPGPILAAAVLK